ncbi:MAG: SAM-dependent DNA methyltransferase, partial [Deltaproteobacteria bacterium]|nr:SAM-dependent DNA methyltransferase [Deltaproteobacteria bacterium]
MPPLNKFQRNLLEAAVVKARNLAEDGARAVLGYLGVAEASAPSYLNEGQRDLRQRLRDHGRQLGDTESDDRTQTLDILVEEIAYEHWHRMLFAKFLAENDLLMYTGHGSAVPVTLEECAELAQGEGAADGWELAARCASRMLPQIFRSGSPVFEVVFPPECSQGLEKVIASLPTEIYMAQDSRGWLYQFWQTKRKAEVNASEDKIGERELPAVTQLFTEAYMVSFLLDNSLGAWWAARKLTETALAAAECEAELRRRAALPGVPLDYLRFVRDGEGPWALAAGAFERWPDNLADFRIFDPCCGSGHFLTAAFRMLVPMRMEAEGLSSREAVDAVLRDNLHGLEIDRRCVELAAFALAMDAWTYPGAEGYRELQELNVACSGISVGARKEDWTALADGAPALQNSLAELYDTFADAPVLGSLIDPRLDDNAAGLLGADWTLVKPLLDKALSAETSSERTETAVAAKGIAEAALLLSRRYTLVITNVPYLSSGKHSEALKKHCRDYYPEAKSDLATVFLDRCLTFCTEGGTVAAATPQNWLSLTSYAKFRVRLLKEDTWQIFTRLGPGAFETISGEVVKAVLVIISRGFKDGNILSCIDVSGHRSASDKSKALSASGVVNVGQARQLDNPDARVSGEEIGSGELLELFAIASQGIKTGDDPLSKRCFWEIGSIDSGWQLYQSTVDFPIHYGGRTSVIDWRMNGAGMVRPRLNNKNVGTRGVAVSEMRDLAPTIYTGELFDSNVGPISPVDEKLLPALWCYCSSPEYNETVRAIDKALKVTNATLVKVPFDMDRWTQAAKMAYPHGLPLPYTDDPTQWIFHGHPCGSV